MMTDSASPHTSTSVTAAAPRTPLMPRPPLVTPVLIGINVLIYLLMVLKGASPISPDPRQVLMWGASWGPLTVGAGQWWRLFTACFLHFGILHIGMNMFILYQVGNFTEPLFGRVRFLIMYVVAGLGGNVLGLYLHPMSISAGASGAIFGVYGGLLAFLFTQRRVLVTESAKAVTRSILIFLGYNLIYGLADRHTDLTAHIGGLATGFLLGAILARSAPLRSA